SEETFYAWDERTGQPVEAPRGTLFWGDHAPALEGAFTVQGPEGPIETETVFTVMRRRLEDYTPEKAAPMCGLHPDAIRKLARKIAARPTKIICSLSNAGKHYHGDLVERSQLLLLGLTGNWGRKGTGVQAWLTGFFDGWLSVASKSRRGPDDTAMIMDMRDRLMAQAMEADPTLTPALIAIEGGKRAGAGATATVPPVFFWYNHAGYRDSWERSEWHDPSMERPFQEYLNEALEKGWWSGVDYPRPEQTPRVLVECGGNVLRRTRGGSRMLLEHLWPKLNMVVTLDVRMSTTALYSDFVLPIAHQYEKIGFGIPSSHTMNLTFCDRAVEPPGEAVNEWEAFRRLTEKLQERAKARGIKTYTDSRGTDHDLATCHDTYTRNDQFVDEDLMADEMIRDTAIMGTIPEDASLADIRRKGYYRWQGLGVSARALTQATEPRPDETFAPNRNRVEKGEPWPTLTRRAQFLIDHPWFLEADEHLPRHKDAPKAGGDYPFQITSGHNRWSIHSLNTANELMLETHRGTPHLVINVEDAKSLDIEDNDDVRVYNDRGEFTVPALLSASARPGQVIMYNGFEPYQFRNWAGPNDLEPGMIKWLHLAGGYGHLRYWGTQWQPCPVMRNTHVNLEKSQ
ncbi:MAG: molybdopterin-dependent oxidoreductase, partial [Gammaproteobacteria bacterium]